MRIKKIMGLTMVAAFIAGAAPVYAQSSNHVVLGVQHNVNSNSGQANTDSNYGVGQGIKWPTQVDAPFADMTAWMNNPEYSDGGALNLTKVSEETGIKFFNLGFIQSTGAPVTNGEIPWGWGGYSVLSQNDPSNTQYQGINKSIKDFRQHGGDVSISFGGEDGISFWQQTQNVNVLYNTYLNIVKGYGLTRMDLDIEGSAQDYAQNVANAKAIKKLQETTGIQVDLTLPVLPTGLTPVQLKVLQAYLEEGVNVNCVNIMTMCYGQDALLPGQNYGTASLSAVNYTMKQVQEAYKEYQGINLTDAQAYRKIGTTPAIGFSGAANPIFTPEWANLVVNQAIEKGLGMVSYWSINTDAKLNWNQGIKTPYTFSPIFQKFGNHEDDSLPMSSNIAPVPAPVPAPAPVPVPTPVIVNGVSAWATGIAYKTGELVTYDGNEYKCLQAHNSIETWNPMAAPALWQLVAENITSSKVSDSNKTTDSNKIANSNKISAWATGIAYKTGELVTYDGNEYKCLQAHNSIETWNPIAAPALWKLM